MQNTLHCWLINGITCTYHLTLIISHQINFHKIYFYVINCVVIDWAIPDDHEPLLNHASQNPNEEITSEINFLSV